MSVFNALLLLGPTGSGKSPLGDHLESVGIFEKRCFHFDFGAHLRRANGDPHCYPSLDAHELQVIENVLRSGALLEDHQFTIVEKLFVDFAAEKGISGDDWVLLNGMPRHVGQAVNITRFATVRCVIYLECDEKLVYERIAANAGGDRTGRIDDDWAAVRNKLEIFKSRTMPLVEHYRDTGAAIVVIPVGIDTKPANIAALLPRL